MRLTYLASLAALAAACLLSLSLGPAGLVNPLSYLEGGPERGIIEYRAVRTSALLLIGVSLGAAGAAMQQALRNPLVDPYIVGLSSGASLGSVAAIVYGLTLPPLIHASAFAGGLLAFGAVLATSAVAGLTGYSLIVVGVAYSYLFSSATLLLILYSPEKAASSLFWLMGSAAYIERGLLAASIPLTLAGVAAVAALSKALEVLSLGEEYAEGLGVSVARLRAAVAVAAALTVAPLVALAGPIGFIGLTAPWVARLAGARRFQEVLAGAALYGALLALTADIIARVALAPREVPLTIVTSLFGAPLLVYLSVRGGGRW